MCVCTARSLMVHILRWPNQALAQTKYRSVNIECEDERKKCSLKHWNEVNREILNCNGKCTLFKLAALLRFINFEVIFAHFCSVRSFASFHLVSPSTEIKTANEIGFKLKVISYKVESVKKKTKVENDNRQMKLIWSAREWKRNRFVCETFYFVSLLSRSVCENRFESALRSFVCTISSFRFHLNVSTKARLERFYLVTVFCRNLIFSFSLFVCTVEFELKQNVSLFCLYSMECPFEWKKININKNEWVYNNCVAMKTIMQIEMSATLSRRVFTDLFM